jgi:membrane-associated phospholipid phosphatase
MTDTAPSRRTGLTAAETSAPAPSGVRRYGYVWRLWLVVVLFSAVVLARSAELGVPVRDPGGQMFRSRLTKALVVLLVLALAEAVVRARARGLTPGNVVRVLRERWSGQRVLLVLTGLVGYFLVYLGYRNLKSWNAFNTLRDDDLLHLDRTIFLGHSPAELLHGLFGEDFAATLLHAVYTSFSYLVLLSVVASLVLIPQTRRAYVFLAAATWTWILGAVSYYLVPSLGPFASAPSQFVGLSGTGIAESQAKLLVDRAEFLADPSAAGSFVSIGAFASLHVGFTFMVFLMARYYRLQRTSIALGIYLAAVILATVYFGYHYVVDDVAGLLLGGLAVLLGKWTVEPPLRRGRETG